MTARVVRLLAIANATDGGSYPSSCFFLSIARRGRRQLLDQRHLACFELGSILIPQHDVLLRAKTGLLTEGEHAIPGVFRLRAGPCYMPRRNPLDITQGMVDRFPFWNAARTPTCVARNGQS